MEDSELKKLFDQYILQCEFTARLRPETIRGFKATFRNFTLLMPEAKTVESLTPALMLDFFQRLQFRKRQVGISEIKVGIKDSTVKTYWSKLNSFFEWLSKSKLVERNPLETLKPPQPVYDDLKALETVDIHKIIAAINIHANNAFQLKRDMAIISLLIYCGLRRNELLALEHRDINLEDRLLTVRGETSKSKRSRQIPLNPTIMFHLEEYVKEVRKKRKTTQYFISSATEDSGMTRHGLNHWVKRLRELSGIKFHVHKFRHTFACNLARQNVSTIKIQKLLGHADLRMTMAYLRSLTVEDLRDDVNKLVTMDLI